MLDHGIRCFVQLETDAYDGGNNVDRRQMSVLVSSSVVDMMFEAVKHSIVDNQTLTE